MKALSILFLLTISGFVNAFEPESVSVDQELISKSLDFDPDSETQVSAISFDNYSVLEMVFPNGLRIEVEDLVGLSGETHVQAREPERVYGFTWQPEGRLIGLGVETEVEERNGREVLKMRPSLRASKNFEGRNFEGSVFLKPLWDSRENSAGLKVGVKIDF